MLTCRIHICCPQAPGDENEENQGNPMAETREGICFHSDRRHAIAKALDQTADENSRGNWNFKAPAREYLGVDIMETNRLDVILNATTPNGA